jgi:hypothetical protein
MRNSVREIAFPHNFLANAINYTAVDILQLANMQSDIPNQCDDLPTRLRHAKDFLQAHPNEKPITAARIYDLQPSTLYSSLERKPTGTRGGHNKVLQEHHQ